MAHVTHDNLAEPPNLHGIWGAIFARVTVTRGADGQLTSSAVTMQSAALGGVAGSIAGKGAGAWAYLLGTSFLASTDVDGEFLISGVPAGSYQLAPGLLGVTGSSVDVTVVAGSVTVVETPLAMGPVITGIEPSGFVPFEWDERGYPALKEVRIKGSGFGSSIGLTQVRYAGIDLSDHVSVWSDDEIVISSPRSWVDSGADPSVVEVDALRFTLVQPEGEARSEPAGIVRMILGSSYPVCPDFPFESANYFVAPYASGRLVRGAQVDLTVSNGRALEAAGETEVSQVLTNELGCAMAFVEGDSSARLPTVVRASFMGVDSEAVALANYPVLFLDPGVVTRGGEHTFTGVLEAASGLPVADDGNFSVRFDGTCGATPVPLQLDGDGHFEVTFAIPEYVCSQGFQILYRGALVASEWVDLQYP